MDPDFWAPLTAIGRFRHDDEDRLTNRDSYWLVVAGKMRRAGDRKSVQAEMHVLAKQVYLAHGGKNESLDPMVGSKGDFQDAAMYPLTMIPGPYRGYVSAFSGGLLAVFALLLIIACTNAASLLLARATGRAREMATRSALGAGRGRLIRQMLVESLMLAGMAGAAGVAIAWITSRMFMELKPSSVPLTLAIPMDWRVVLFTAAISAATGVLFGLAPALRASAVQSARVLKEESQTGSLRKSRLRSTLVVVQMAACVVLLGGAALCVRSLMNANAIDARFRHASYCAGNTGSGQPWLLAHEGQRLLRAAAGAGGASARRDLSELREVSTSGNGAFRYLRRQGAGQGFECDDGGRVPRGARDSSGRWGFHFCAGET